MTPPDQMFVKTGPVPVTIPMNPPERDMLLINIHERISRMEVVLENIGDSVADHETRLRSNERWRWGIPGGFIATLLAVLGLNIPHS